MQSVAQLLVQRKPFLTVLALCAMTEEAAHLKKQLVDNAFIQAPNDRLFRRGLIVDVKTTGIGMVNSAANASFYIHDVRPDIVINLGCAGAHDFALKQGDVVVGESHVSTANVIVRDDGILPYGDRDMSQLVFASDATLVGMARKSLAHLTKWKGSTEPVITVGRVASSDTWMDSVEGVTRLRELFGTTCEDMEAAAIALVAQVHHKPFLALKDISNSVFLGAATDSFDSVEHKVPALAGKNAASVAAKMLRDISSMTG